MQIIRTEDHIHTNDSLRVCQGAHRLSAFMQRMSVLRRLTHRCWLTLRSRCRQQGSRWVRR